MIDIKGRKRAEQRFQWYGKAGIGLAFLALVVLLTTLVSNGWKGFFRTEIQVAISTEHSNERTALRKALYANFQDLDLDRSIKRHLNGLLSNAAYDVAREAIRENKPGIHWVAASNVMDAQIKGEITDPDTPTYHYVQTLKEAGKTRLVFNPTFFSEADSRSPSRAGFLGAILGSIFTMAICLMVAFPLGVMTAVYLEEFAPKNRLTDIIEVNINNLAAVPSIVFGLLGLAVFLHFFDLPRSAPVVGGLTLALMTLPVIIISTRVALKAIPDSIRQAALALGATRLQAVTQHVIPLAIPGIMTGTILGAARALGETAPLLMIGMVAFIADVPQGFTDPATVMPVQIYIWASSPESGFVEKTSAGILTLLVFLLLMNATAIYIRKKFEVRW